MDALTPMLRNSLIVSTGTHIGFDWATTFNRETEYWCGYMKVPADHPWYSLPLCEIDKSIEVRGGLTFGGGRDFHQSDPDSYWIGFDCCHAFDVENFADQRYIEGQCRSMCEQANAVLPCIDIEVISNYEILISEGQV